MRLIPSENYYRNQKTNRIVALLRFTFAVLEFLKLSSSFAMLLTGDTVLRQS